MTEKRARRSAVATRRGDDGTTGLLFGNDRVPKDDPRTEAYGAVDEAVAALGLVRAELTQMERRGELPRVLAGLAEVVLRIQRELFVAAAELATAPGATDRQRPGETRVSADMVAGLDTILAETEAHVQMPHEFVVPGETRLSAELEMARTIVRRAERRAVGLRRPAPLPGESPLFGQQPLPGDGVSAGDGPVPADESLPRGQLVPYLNRLADLLWVLARAAEQGEARTATPSRPGGRRRPGSAGGDIPA
ncbi:MAG TPA: ATP:cob(I)alamin adenosyltransferase [Candidatus Limnocylindrales bacterium]